VSECAIHLPSVFELLTLSLLCALRVEKDGRRRPLNCPLAEPNVKCLDVDPGKSPRGSSPGSENFVPLAGVALLCLAVVSLWLLVKNAY